VDALQYEPPSTEVQQQSKEPRRRERSWWRNVYDQISQTGYDKEPQDTILTPSLPRRLQGKSKTRVHSEARQTLLSDNDLEDLPPSSTLYPTQPNTARPLPTIHRVPPSEGGSSVDERDVLAPLNSNWGRRRSAYRPKRHKHSGSSSSILPLQPSPLGIANPDPPSPPGSRSSVDMVELDPRYGSDMQLGVLPKGPNNPYNRSDSLFGRIFPPSEIGSMEGRTPRETDSAYSLPSISTEAPHGMHFEGDRRKHVHEHIHHPSQSAYALHSPWTAEVHQPESPISPGVSDDGQPPPLPAKDLNYVPTFRRSNPTRRDLPSHKEHASPLDLGASLPSLPEDAQFLPPRAPFFASRNDTERSSTLVDTPTSPQSAYFADGASRSSWTEPQTPHANPVRGLPPDGMLAAVPPPPSSVVIASYEESYARRQAASPQDDAYSGSGSSVAPVQLLPSKKPKPASLHKKEKAERRPSRITVNPPPIYLPDPSTFPIPEQRGGRYPPRSALDVDGEGADDDAVSVNTFYTATSQPRSMRGRR